MSGALGREAVAQAMAGEIQATIVLLLCLLVIGIVAVIVQVARFWLERRIAASDKLPEIAAQLNALAASHGQVTDVLRDLSGELTCILSELRETRRETRREFELLQAGQADHCLR